MRHRARLVPRLVFSFAGSAALAAAPPAAAPDLPLVNGRKALATVNGEAVTWDSFKDALASVHEGAKDDAKRAKQDPQALLERLITGKLVVQEARNIGLDQDEAFKASIRTFREETLQKMLLERRANTVKAADPADVESIYKTRVGVAKLDSLLFKSESDAKAFAEAAARGKEFDAAARDAVAAGRATEDRAYEVKLAEAQPEVAGAVARLAKGGVSGALRVPTGFTVLRLLDLSVPDDPAARKESQDQALSFKRLQVVGGYTRDLRVRYAKVDQKLVDGLDFEADRPGLEGYEKDTRVVATVEGAAPITVGDLARTVHQDFFHGVERAAKEKRINGRKPAALDGLLVARLTQSEAKRTGLDRSAEFLEQLREYSDGLLFGAFVQKVVLPDVKVQEPEARAYYDAHRADYSTPAMLRLDSIPFARREDAQGAWKKAQEGADFGWLKGNAPGRLAPAADVMQLGGEVYEMEAADPELMRVLTDPKPGDARLFAAPDGRFYVVLVREVLPAKTQAYEEARPDAARQVLNEKTKKVLDEWSRKLRAAYAVKTFVTPAQLDALVKREFGPGAEPRTAAPVRS